MKRPWNIIDSPIYSLQTTDKNGKVNMNICTYVTAISMSPKLYAIAIDFNTNTYLNVENSEFVNLQILCKDQMLLVKKFGKKSGIKFNKDKFLRDNNLLINWNNSEVLSGLSALIKLKKKSCFKTNGDHALYIFKVENFKTFSEDNILTFQDLVKNKIIL